MPYWMVYFGSVSHCWYYLAISKSGNVSLNILLSSLVDENEWLELTHFKARMISCFLTKSFLALFIWVPFRFNALLPYFLNIHCPYLSFSSDKCSFLEMWIFTRAIPPPLIENIFEHNLHRAETTSVLQGWIQANSISQDFLYFYSFPLTRHLKNWIKLERWR